MHGAPKCEINLKNRKAGLSRLKAAWRNLMREVRLSRAQRHAAKAMFMYLKDGLPETSLLIASAVRHSLVEDDMRRQTNAAKEGR